MKYRGILQPVSMLVLLAIIVMVEKLASSATGVVVLAVLTAIFAALVLIGDTSKEASK